jgi:hypothetical protein
MRADARIADVLASREGGSMTGRRISLKGFLISKGGKIEHDQRGLPVSLRLKKVELATSAR